MRTLIGKNKQTGKVDVIEQQDLEMLDWGFHFFVDSELDAYKAAYIYRNAPNGVIIQFAAGAQKWMITVFNQFAADAGMDGAHPSWQQLKAAGHRAPQSKEAVWNTAA